MLKKINNYYLKLGGSSKDREEGSELKRILRLVRTNEQSELLEMDDLKLKKGKRKLKSRFIKPKGPLFVQNRIGQNQVDTFSIYREEELTTSINQYDVMLDATRRFKVC
jgi:hypothetical protein